MEYWPEKIKNAIKTISWNAFGSWIKNVSNGVLTSFRHCQAAGLSEVVAPGYSLLLKTRHLWHRHVDSIYESCNDLQCLLNCLKILLSPSVPPSALLWGVCQKSQWQCLANLEAWVNKAAGCVLGHGAGWWFVLRNGTSGNMVIWRQISSAATAKSCQNHELEPMNRLYCLQSQYWWRFPVLSSFMCTCSLLSVALSAASVFNFEETKSLLV